MTGLFALRSDERTEIILPWLCRGYQVKLVRLQFQNSTMSIKDMA